MTLGDILKIVIKVKVVPDDAPNDDGVFQYLDVHEHRIRDKTDWEYINSILPKGLHAVQVGRA